MSPSCNVCCNVLPVLLSIDVSSINFLYTQCLPVYNIDQRTEFVFVFHGFFVATILLLTSSMCWQCTVRRLRSGASRNGYNLAARRMKLFAEHANYITPSYRPRVNTDGRYRMAMSTHKALHQTRMVLCVLIALFSIWHLLSRGRTVELLLVGRMYYSTRHITPSWPEDCTSSR